MSARKVPGIEVRERRHRDGTRYEVFRARFTDPETGRRHWRTFDTLDDAQDFQAHVRLLRRSGDLEQLSRGKETLAEFVELWWSDYAKVNLSRPTLKTYRALWHKHALPRLGGLQLRQVTPQVVARFRADLERDGIGPSSIYRTMSMLQGVFSRAVEWGYRPTNPFDHAPKPRARRARTVEPLAPRQVEQIRARLIDAGDHRSATLVSVLAYAGLRPQEALALQWRHLGGHTLLIEQKLVEGTIVPGLKTRLPRRDIDLFEHLRRDLIEHRMRLGRPADAQLIFGRADGEPWRDHDVRNWRRRTYSPAALEAGVEYPRPYDLRHSFASLLLQEGRLSHVEIAGQMGHGIDMLWRTYAHEISELRGQAGVSADELIEAARANESPAAQNAATN